MGGPEYMYFVQPLSFLAYMNFFLLLFLSEPIIIFEKSETMVLKLWLEHHTLL